MDKSTRHLPARLAPLFHGVGTIIHETGVERAASTGYVASAAGPREGLKRSDSQTTFADDVRTTGNNNDRTWSRMPRSDTHS